MGMWFWNFSIPKLLSRTSIVEGGNKIVESLKVDWTAGRGEVKLSIVKAPANQSLNIVAIVTRLTLISPK